jgi:hypothetical protein
MVHNHFLFGVTVNRLLLKQYFIINGFYYNNIGLYTHCPQKKKTVNQFYHYTYDTDTGLTSFPTTRIDRK